MQDELRCQIYRELSRLWRRPAHFDRSWSPLRRVKLIGLLEMAGYADLARAEEPRLRQLGAMRAEPVVAGWEPVESVYFPWTSDPSASMPFSHQTGYLMGDAAAHMLALYESLGVTVPASLAGRPDHLSLQLDLMSLLTLHASPANQHQFLMDHLSWLPLLHRAMNAAGAGALALALSDLTQGFVAAERSALEYNLQVR